MKVNLCNLKGVSCKGFCASENYQKECGILEKGKFMSEKILSERLSLIQKELKCEKKHNNSFGRYNYRTLEDIQEALKPKLDGLSFTFSDEIILVGDRFYVKSTATISDGKSSISASAMAREPQLQKGMSESQVTISASSYARKGASNGLLLLDDTTEETEVDNQDNTVVSKIKSLEQLIKKTKSDKGQLLAYFKVDSLGSLNSEQEAKAFTMLEKKLS